MKKIYLYGEIYPGEIDEKFLQKELSGISKDDELVVYINSPGGSVFTGLAIYNILKEYSPIIRIVGLAGSIASVIACSGTIQIAESAFMLIHNPWSFSIGDSNYMRKVAKNLDSIKASILKVYHRKTGKTEDELSAIMDRDEYLSSQECIDLNLADSIIDDPAERNAIIEEFYQYVALNYKHKTDNDFIPQIEDGYAMITLDEATKQIGRLESDVNAKVTEIQNLQSQLSNIQKERDQQADQIKNLNTTVESLTTERDALAADKQQLTDKLGNIHNREITLEVDKFLVENNSKITPAEKGGLRDKLIALAASDVKVGDKTLYEIEKEVISNRGDMNLEDEMFDGQPKPPSGDTRSKFTEFDMDDMSDRMKVDKIVNQMAVEQKISYIDAYNQFKEGK